MLGNPSEKGKVTDKIACIGADLAKNIIQAHGVDSMERVVLMKAISRQKFLEWFANLKPRLVAMEACSAAHYWARKLRALGHEVRLISRSPGCDAQVATHAKYDSNAQRVMAVIGIGPLTASASVASSGGKTRLGRITKQGNTYRRTLLFHGERSASAMRQCARTSSRNA